MNSIVHRCPRCRETFTASSFGERDAKMSSLTAELEKVQKKLGECEGGFETGTKAIKHNLELITELEQVRAELSVAQKTEEYWRMLHIKSYGNFRSAESKNAEWRGLNEDLTTALNNKNKELEKVRAELQSAKNQLGYLASSGDKEEK